MTNLNHFTLFFFALLLLGCNEQPVENTQSHSRPNVILIMTDDQGFGDLGFHNNPIIKTPVLDNLGKNSTRFKQFYVSPVCAPTRSSLLTGRFTLRTGVQDTYNGGAVMATEETTIAEILRDNGYQTGIFGKWHLGDNYPSRPKDQGFQESLVHLGGGIGQVGDYVNYHAYDSSYFDPVLFKDGKPTPTKGYCSDVYTDAAIDFVKRNTEKPFFLYLAFNAPHTPLQLPQQYYDQYANLDSVPGNLGYNRRPALAKDSNQIEVTKKIYGMVTNIDDNVGRLMQQLEASGLQENTLVVFLTDNGPQQYRYNGNLRAQKGSVYEGGIRVPCFWHWPGKLDLDAEINTFAGHVDVLPTVLGLCNIPVPAQIKMDGIDLSRQLLGQNQQTPERSLIFEWQRGFPEPYRNIAVRRGPYKLVGQAPYTAGVEALELYHIDNDPYEQNNISQQHPEITQLLKEEFDTYLEEGLSRWPELHPRIAIGTAEENPVILNRNDAKGSGGIWRQDQVFGYWDVDVTQGGNYDLEVHFFETVEQEGKLYIRIGPMQRTMDNDDPDASMLRFENVPLIPGEFMVECWYQGKQRKNNLNFSHFPFYISVEKKASS